MKVKKGFTMLEVVLIMVVIGLGILSVVIATHKIEVSNVKLFHSIIANNLAVQGLEQAYASDTLQEESTDFCINGIGRGTGCNNQTGLYHRTISITTGNETNNPTITIYNVCSEVYFGSGDSFGSTKICSLIKNY